MSACPKGPDDLICGRDHAGCTAHNRSGGPCGGIPMRGTDPKHCRKHVGRKTEIVKAEWNARQEGERIKAEYDLPVQSDPLNELLRLKREILDWKNACRILIEIHFKSGGVLPPAEVKMYEASMDRAARVLVDIVRLGVEARLAKVEEKQTTLAIKAVDAALTELAPILGYDPDRPEIRAVVSKHLRAIQREEDPQNG